MSAVYAKDASFEGPLASVVLHFELAGSYQATVGQIRSSSQLNSPIEE